MNVKSSLVGLGTIAAIGLATSIFLGAFEEQFVAPIEAEPAGPVGQIEVEPIQSVDVDTRTVDGVELPPAFFQKLAPFTRVELHLDPKDFKSGIPCGPGGGFLPLLNGVPYAATIPRDYERDGPVPPVIAKAANNTGLEWYLHADGSSTTTHWRTVTVMGKSYQDVYTLHGSPFDDKYAMGIDPRGDGATGGGGGTPPGQK